MSIQEIILLIILVLAVAYVGFRVVKTYGGGTGDAECDKCAANTLRDKKKQQSKGS